jgi:hypothetical protein
MGNLARAILATMQLSRGHVSADAVGSDRKLAPLRCCRLLGRGCDRMLRARRLDCLAVVVAAVGPEAGIA